jgi:hypothetical protein
LSEDATVRVGDELYNGVEIKCIKTGERVGNSESKFATSVYVHNSGSECIGCAACFGVVDMKCRFMPKEVTKDPDDFCGQWQPKGEF